MSGDASRADNTIRRTVAVRRRAIVVTVATVLLTGGSVHAAQDGAAIELIRRECSACHGPRGISVAPTFPHLAGQQAAYLESQLKAFRDRSRADPYAQAFMWGMAAQLTDGMIAEIAAYYAAQPPAPARVAHPADGDAGRRIYEEGIEEEHVPPCESCHRKNGEGAAVIPRLAGQHKGYLEKQLEYFVTGLRTDPTMRASVRGLMPLQIAQVAGFLASRDRETPQAALVVAGKDATNLWRPHPCELSVALKRCVMGSGLLCMWQRLTRS